MEALIIGGTGPTGPHIIDGLLARNFEETIMHRGVHEVGLSSDIEHIHDDLHFMESLEQSLQDRTFDLVVVTYGRLRFTAQVIR